MNGQAVKGSPFLIKIEEIKSEAVAVSQHATSQNNLNSMPAAATTRSSRPEPNRKFIEALRRFNSVSNLHNLHSSNLNSTPADKRNLLKPVVDFEKNIRVELIYLPNDKSEQHTVGDEITLSVKIVGYDLTDKNRKILLTNIQAQVKHDEKPVNHKLEVLANGTYQLKFFPTKAGLYYVTFLREGKKIDGMNSFVVKTFK